jgi:hypothetical protein
MAVETATAIDDDDKALITQAAQRPVAGKKHATAVRVRLPRVPVLTDLSRPYIGPDRSLTEDSADRDAVFEVIVRITAPSADVSTS